MKRTFNLATGVFPGFNDKAGVMLCGYEWGGGEDDVTVKEVQLTVAEPVMDVIFSNKAPRYTSVAESWPFDRKVRDWFRLWGHELRRDGLGGDFEKTILQTNWCDSQAPNMKGVNYEKKLLDPTQISNFLQHIEEFEPLVLMFFGSSMGRFLNSAAVKTRFQEVVGQEIEKLQFEKLPFEGRRFQVGFQRFERCTVISLPHPSGSRGLSPEYIKLFASTIGGILTDYKVHRGLPN